MKKLLVAALFSLAFLSLAFAETTTSVVTVASVVGALENTNPSIIVGIDTAVSTGMTGVTRSDLDSTEVTGINLTEDGSYTFVLMTSQEVNLSHEVKSCMEIEIIADGFHLYDYDYSGAYEGSSMDESSIKARNAVPLLSTTPEINIPTFSGKDQNVSVYSDGASGNKINVQFNKGVTKADLILGTFSIEWKGKRPLDPGIYKAKVMVLYSLP